MQHAAWNIAGSTNVGTPKYAPKHKQMHQSMPIHQSTHTQPRVYIHFNPWLPPTCLRHLERAIWPVAPGGSVTGISVSISRPTPARLGQTVVDKEKGAFYTQVHICTIQVYPALNLHVFLFCAHISPPSPPAFCFIFSFIFPWFFSVFTLSDLSFFFNLSHMLWALSHKRLVSPLAPTAPPALRYQALLRLS
jgi:hypothetical protein